MSDDSVNPEFDKNAERHAAEEAMRRTAEEAAKVYAEETAKQTEKVAEHAAEAEKLADEVVAAARKVAREIREAMDKTVGSVEQDLASLGKEVSEFGSRNPIVVGVGVVVAVMTVLFASLHSASSARRK